MIQQCHIDEKKTRALWDQMEFITPSVACKKWRNSSYWFSI